MMKCPGIGPRGAVLFLCLLAGCATMPDPRDEAAMAAYEEANDPLEPWNRYVFEINHLIDEVLVKPFAGYYRIAVPDIAQDALRNVVRNLDTPAILANDLMQGDLDRAGDTAGRFLVNSTIGIGGMIDVAHRFGMPYHHEDFGQTLGVHGVAEGYYMVLPVLGPSNPRDSTGRLVDYALNPLIWVGYVHNLNFLAPAQMMAEGLDTRARNLSAVADLQNGSVDFYVTVRSLYRQRRQDMINNGN